MVKTKKDDKYLVRFWGENIQSYPQAVDNFVDKFIMVYVYSFKNDSPMRYTSPAPTVKIKSPL